MLSLVRAYESNGASMSVMITKVNHSKDAVEEKEIWFDYCTVSYSSSHEGIVLGGDTRAISRIVIVCLAFLDLGLRCTNDG
jgi:hypothetical protein